MVSELSENDEAVMSVQNDLVGETGKRRRFSLLQKDEPANKEMRRNTCYDSYYNYDDYLLDDDTIKVEMGLDEENNKTVSKGGRGRPMKQNETHVWSDEATEALIHLWNQKEELFQKQHPHFYVPEYKEKAIESIRQSLEEQGHIATSNQILSKFQSLRTYFCSQRNKLIAAKKNGNEEEVESKWRFYKNLMFLDQNMKPREKVNSKHQNRDNTQEGESRDSIIIDDNLQFHPDGSNGHETYSENSMVVVGSHLSRVEPITVPEYISSPDLVPTEGVEGTQKAMPSSSSNFINSGLGRNEDLIFGELVGNMLQQLPSSQGKDYLKLEIQQLILKQKYTSANETPNDSSSEIS